MKVVEKVIPVIKEMDNKTWFDLPDIYDSDIVGLKKTLPTKLLPLRLFQYDGANKATGQGFGSNEEFIGNFLETEGAFEVDISLFPSTSKYPVFEAKFISNIANYNQRPDDIASLIYQQDRPQFLINKEMDFGDDLRFITLFSIYESSPEEDPSVNIKLKKFVVESYVPTYAEDGSFISATLTLRRVVSYVIKKIKEDGSGAFNYNKFNFFKIPVQPLAPKRIKIEMEATTIFWGIDLKNESGVSIDFNYSEKMIDEYNFVPLISPFLPKNSAGNTLNFVPLWPAQTGYNNTNSEDGIGVRTKNIVGSNGEQTSNIDEEFNFENEDSTRTKGLIPERRYLYTNARTLTGRGIADKRRKENFAQIWKLLDFSTPFNAFGYDLAKTIEEADSSKLPRIENTTGAPWKNYKEQLLYYYDLVQNIEDVVVEVEVRTYASRDQDGGAGGGTKITKEIKPQYYENSLISLKRSGTILGESISTFPDDIIKDQFDFSGNPNTWNKEEIKKYLGVVFVSRDQGSTTPPYNVRGICPILNYQIPLDKYKVSQTNSISGGSAIGASFLYDYYNTTLIKSIETGINFYSKGKSIVVELEWDSDPTLITEFTMRYFGGYQFTISYFQNTYEDSLTQGDILCQYELNGEVFDLPPLTYKADNLSGAPRKTKRDIIYGSGNESPIVGLIQKSNLKRVNDGKKTIIDIKTGKKIKIKNKMV